MFKLFSEDDWMVMSKNIKKQLESSYAMYIGLIGFLALFLSIIGQVIVLFLNDLPIQIFSISQTKIDSAIILTMTGVIVVLLLLTSYNSIGGIVVYLFLSVILMLIAKTFIANWILVILLVTLLAIVIPLLINIVLREKIKPLSIDSIKTILFITLFIPPLYFLYNFTDSNIKIKYVEYGTGSENLFGVEYMNDQWTVLKVSEPIKERKVIKTSEIKSIIID